MKEVLLKISSLGLKPGCIDKRISSLPPAAIAEIEDAIDFGENRDIAVKIGRMRYILEIVVDGIEPEVDLNLLTVREYIDRYGEEAVQKFKW